MKPARPVPVLALGLGVTAWLVGASHAAHAERLQIGADLTSGFGAGKISEVAQPSVGASATARVLLNRWLAVGVMGGLRHEKLSSTDELSWNPQSQLTTTLAGVSTRLRLTELAADTRPFFGLDAGYAGFSSDHPDFAGQPEKRRTNGFFAAPQLGIETAIGRHFGFEAAVRYDYVRAHEALEIGNTQARDLSGAGLAAGFFFTL
jgi:hypothetical protein